MADSPILICYDGSTDASRGIEAAASLLKETRAVVLDVGPPLTVAESYASIGATTPGFEELNEDAALLKGGERCPARPRRRVDPPRPVARSPPRCGTGSSRWPTRSTQR